MSWTPYGAEEYVDFHYVETFCRTLADQHPEWAELEEVGRSHQGRALLLLTIGKRGAGPDGLSRGERPALWLDAGTHASEFTGVSAVLFVLSQWIERLVGGDEGLKRWFSSNEVVVMPCISPDGVQAMAEGAPFLRSSMSPPRDGMVRSGLDACDIDGDGAVRMMRWKHPAGSFVLDEDWAPFMRPRRLDDDPEEAFFLCNEGEFVNWDGVRWTTAPREFGVDLNRNFPGSWEPFSMFGMHGGAYALSEPESRAVVDCFAAHPRIGCALTMHTYTGCILTQPYRKDSPLQKGDLELMERLAREMVEGTGYKVYKTYPEFMYDKDRAIVGVWADTMSTVFGVPGFTVELWDPMGYAGLEIDNPIEFLMRPPEDKLKAMLKKFAEDSGNVAPWKRFDHPQLGEVEIGGLEYLRTVRNPPAKELRTECEHAFTMCERARLSLPRVRASVEVVSLGEEVSRVRLVLENEGFLPTSALERGSVVAASRGVLATIALEEGLHVEEATSKQMEHMEGWGNVATGAARNQVYAGLSARGHRQFAEWTVYGEGTLHIHWEAGRASRGSETVNLK